MSRLMIVFKGVKREIKQLVHPKSVNLIRINRKKISDETLRGVYVYLMAYATAGNCICVDHFFG